MPNSFFSDLTKLVPSSTFEPAPPADHAVLEYEDYDIFQPCREIDAVIDNKLYLGE